MFPSALALFPWGPNWMSLQDNGLCHTPKAKNKNFIFFFFFYNKQKIIVCIFLCLMPPHRLKHQKWFSNKFPMMIIKDSVKFWECLKLLYSQAVIFWSNALFYIYMFSLIRDGIKWRLAMSVQAHCITVVLKTCDRDCVNPAVPRRLRLVSLQPARGQTQGLGSGHLTGRQIRGAQLAPHAWLAPWPCGARPLSGSRTVLWPTYQVMAGWQSIWSGLNFAFRCLQC